MANEKRLIDADKLKWKLGQVTLYVQGLRFGKTVLSKILESYRQAVFTEIDDAPTVDAVEVDKYIELREQYDRLFTVFHELRDSFVDYVCSGVPNPSPFCKDKRHGCCDSYGWCKHDDQCTGFNPVEGFSDGERKDNERTD